MSYERPNVRRMSGYTWGEQPDDNRTIKLNTNENPYPPSPAVARALAAIDAGALRRYPEPTAARLRDQIANLHDLHRDNVVITHGGDEGLRLAFTTFVAPGTAFGMADPSYSLYPVLAEIQDARVVRVPLGEDWDLPRDFAHQLNDAGANLACLVNPHAPSGQLMEVDRVSQLANDFRGVLLLDEAYADFVDPALRYDAIRLVNAFDNLLILRTFSKGYSLAGLRLGYLVGSKTLIAPIMGKTRDSYNVDHISQALGLAALSDRAYAENSWDKVRASRRVLREGLLALGFNVPVSQANFVLAEVSLGIVPTAAEIYQALKARGILVRYFDTPALEDKLRISVGTDAENDTLLGALGEILS